MKTSTKTELSLLGTFLIAGLVFFSFVYLFSMVEIQGFNPSDDGVILAQSFRVVTGELPHKDFISSKPVVSTYLHTIHFFSGLPLQISARYFVLFQLFTIAATWFWTLFFAFYYSGKQAKFPFATLFFAFLVLLVLTCNIFFLFPWTTIDALFFAFPALAFARAAIDGKSELVNWSIALFLIGLAALSRQTFVFAAIFLFLYAAFLLIKQGKYKVLLISLIVGSIPFMLYLSFLLYYHIFSSFIMQLSGRTELVYTAIIQPIKGLAKSNLVFLHLFVFSLFLIAQIRPKLRRKFRDFTCKNRLVIAGFYFFIIVSMLINFYVFNYSYAIYWEIFWLSVNALILIWFNHKLRPAAWFILLGANLAGYLGAVSLGTNFPAYTLGISFSIIALFFYLSAKRNDQKLSAPAMRNFSVFTGFLLVLLAIYWQNNTNYRDLPARSLSYTLTGFSKEFGKIRTNEPMYNYYYELKNVLNRLPNWRNNMVLLPNNAIIYPILNTKNPLATDWAQHDEYLNSEDFFNQKLKQALAKDTMYFILDKFDVKTIATELKEQRWNAIHSNSVNDLFLKLYRVEKYDYYPIILKNCTEMKVHSKYFSVYKPN